MKAIVRIWDDSPKRYYRYRTELAGPSELQPVAMVAYLRAVANEIEEEYKNDCCDS